MAVESNRNFRNQARHSQNAQWFPALTLQNRETLLSKICLDNLFHDHVGLEISLVTTYRIPSSSAKDPVGSYSPPRSNIPFLLIFLDILSDIPEIPVKDNCKIYLLGVEISTSRNLAMFAKTRQALDSSF